MKRARLLIISILCFVLFGACIFFLRNLLFGGVAASYEEAALNKEAYKDQWITYDVVACLGEYAEATETQYFIPTGHEYYYLIWMEDGSIMPLSVSKKADREYLDALTDATYDYIDGKTKMIEMEPRTFVGVVKAQESEAVSYYNGSLQSAGITPTAGYTIRYELLDCTMNRTDYLLLAGGVMLIPILGVVVTIVGYKKEKKKVQGEEAYLPK